MPLISVALLQKPASRERDSIPQDCVFQVLWYSCGRGKQASTFRVGWNPFLLNILGSQGEIAEIPVPTGEHRDGRRHVLRPGGVGSFFRVVLLLPVHTPPW